MLKHFSFEMKCSLFAGIIFIFFFVSSIISIARSHPSETGANNGAWLSPVVESSFPEGYPTGIQNISGGNNPAMINDPPGSGDPYIGNPIPDQFKKPFSLISDKNPSRAGRGAGFVRI
ncbi:MAG: hypothetical protein NTY09_07990 [bacterium]|nr:hypothetical protein [bacterium]